jgi:TPR repeat protein
MQAREGRPGGVLLKAVISISAGLVLLPATQLAIAACSRGVPDFPIVTPPPQTAVLTFRDGYQSGGRGDVLAMTASDRGGDQDIRDAVNRLAIRYARGRGVAKNYNLAFKLFRELARDGYTPGMVNLGILYELGPTGRRDHRRAYAWIRAALALGVPNVDYDATLVKFGMIAGRLGRANTRSAERLAARITETVTSQCDSSSVVYAGISARP